MLQRIILLLVLGWTSFADASVIVNQRYDWFYGNGYFHLMQGTGGGWAETIDARETYYFRETSRNADYVTLHDSSRNLDVRLYANAMYLRGNGETQFRLFRSGHWDDRRLWNYKQNDDQPAYFNLYTAEIWRWARPNQPIVYLREILRNNDQIQLYNAREGYTISLMDNQMWMKVDGASWFKYSDGRW